MNLHVSVFLGSIIFKNEIIYALSEYYKRESGFFPMYFQLKRTIPRSTGAPTKFNTGRDADRDCQSRFTGHARGREHARIFNNGTIQFTSCQPAV